jgi:hypothetical protein
MGAEKVPGKLKNIPEDRHQIMKIPPYWPKPERFWVNHINRHGF